jgi:hypothetical protein
MLKRKEPTAVLTDRRAQKLRQTGAILYRILGNDLPPRHSPRQTLDNLKFVIDHEPRHANLARAWIVNRIFCPETESAILAALNARGEEYVRIPFRIEDYTNITPEFSHFEDQDYSVLLSGETPDDYKRILAHDHAHHRQNCYVMNVNSARNLAIHLGRQRARWILPWDGNCFLTRDGWKKIVHAMEKCRKAHKYIVVPMERILDNSELLGRKRTYAALEEPQLILRNDALEVFDEGLRYGRYSKVEFLKRLGIPGHWDGWDFQPWERRTWSQSRESGAWRAAGWVARLASGQPDFDRDSSLQGVRHRSFARRTAVREGLRRVDRVAVDAAFDADPLFFEQEIADHCVGSNRGTCKTGMQLRERLLREADRALARQPRSVLQKTECAANGDWRTYHSLAPFWWPSPGMPDGKPYTRIDGRRAPEADLNSRRSLAYDSTRLQGVFNDLSTLAWAFHLTRRGAYAAKAVQALEAWFCDPETGMRPHLEFAQVRKGFRWERGQPSGIIDARDIYIAIDAVRLLNRTSIVPEATLTSFRRWLRAYLDWLLNSELGSQERLARNNHGTCYEIQILSISSFLREQDIFLDAVGRARGRLFQQCGPDGDQVREAGRRTPLHYSLFNLQSWMIVAQLMDRGGLRLWTNASRSEALMQAAIVRLVQDLANWREQFAAVELATDRFAARLGQRVVPILHAAVALGLKIPDGARTELVASAALWPHPYSGAPRLWQLACSKSAFGRQRPQNEEARPVSRVETARLGI